MEYPGETPFGAEPVSTSAVVAKPERLSDAGEAKKGPPKLDEWQDFFARVVIRLFVNGWLAFALGDLMDELSPSEIELITLSKDDMREMAAPFATVANNSSFARKHGRSIIAMADSYESVLNLLFWMRRVQRIAKKHGGKPKRQQRRPAQRQSQQTQVVPIQGGSTNGHDGDSSAQVSGVAQPISGVWNPNFG